MSLPVPPFSHDPSATHDGGESPLSPVLADALRANDASNAAATPAPPAGFDRATLGLAQRELRRARSSRRARRWVFRSGSMVAAAAGLALAIWTLWPSHPGPVQRGEHFAVLPTDRTVTILDAYRVARHLASTDSGTVTANTKIDAPNQDLWDANGDGTLDQRDVEELTRRAVSLSQNHGVSNPLGHPSPSPAVGGAS